MIYTNQQFVRWDDIDAFGHVNNAKYLTYIQGSSLFVVSVYGDGCR